MKRLGTSGSCITEWMAILENPKQVQAQLICKRIDLPQWQYSLYFFESFGIAIIGARVAVGKEPTSTSKNNCHMDRRMYKERFTDEHT